MFGSLEVPEFSLLGDTAYERIQDLFSDNLLGFMNAYLCSQNASTTDSLNSSFSGLTEELGLDDNGLVGKSALAQNLEEASLGDVDNGSLILNSGVLLSGFFRNERP